MAVSRRPAKIRRRTTTSGLHCAGRGNEYKRPFLPKLPKLNYYVLVQTSELGSTRERRRRRNNATRTKQKAENKARAKVVKEPPERNVTKIETTGERGKRGLFPLKPALAPSRAVQR